MGRPGRWPAGLSGQGRAGRSRKEQGCSSALGEAPEGKHSRAPSRPSGPGAEAPAGPAWPAPAPALCCGRHVRHGASVPLCWLVPAHPLSLGAVPLPRCWVPGRAVPCLPLPPLAPAPCPLLLSPAPLPAGPVLVTGQRTRTDPVRASRGSPGHGGASQQLSGGQGVRGGGSLDRPRGEAGPQRGTAQPPPMSWEPEASGRAGPVCVCGGACWGGGSTPLRRKRGKVEAAAGRPQT